MTCHTLVISAGGTNDSELIFGSYWRCPLIALTYGVRANGENWGDFGG